MVIFVQLIDDLFTTTLFIQRKIILQLIVINLDSINSLFDS